MCDEGPLMLQLCHACLQGVASLRRELHEIAGKVTSLPGGSVQIAPSQILRASSAVNSAFLLEQLASAFEGGELTVTLKSLLERVESPAQGLEVYRSLLAELRHGNVRAVSLDGQYHTSADPPSVETLLLAEIEARESGNQDDSKPPCILIFPLFRHPTWALVEILLRKCHQERLLVPLELLLEAVAALMHKPNAENQANMEESDILLAIADALHRSGPPGQRARLAVERSGRIVVSQECRARDSATSNADLEDGLNSPFPLYSKEANGHGFDCLAPLHKDDLAQLESTVAELQPHLEFVRAVCGKSRTGVASGPCSRSLPSEDTTVGAILGLLCIIPALSGEEPALGLPEALVHKACGGALLWAFEHATQGAVTDPKGRDTEHAINQGAKGSTEESSFRGLPEALPLGNDMLGASSPSNFPGDSYTVEGGATESSSHCEGEGQDAKNPLAPSQAARSSAATDPENSQQEDQMSQTDLRCEARAMFVQCFKHDLLEHRQLLMSQINNLYKMRNGGDTLRYKEAGYEKLHDFLLDIPGLTPYGFGNKMEIKLTDVPSFKDFSEEICEGRQIPEFQQPQPVPESIQWRVVEVFRQTGCREIPAKNFRDLWNCIFPNDKLHCKDFGYRDVKGLLGNVPVVEKVGTKNNTGYILKPEVLLTEPLDRGAGMWPPGMQPSGGQAPGVRMARAPIVRNAHAGGMVPAQQMVVPVASTQMAPLLPPSQNTIGRTPAAVTTWCGAPEHSGQQSTLATTGAPPAVWSSAPVQVGPVSEVGTGCPGPSAGLPVGSSVGNHVKSHATRSGPPSKAPEQHPNAHTFGNQGQWPVQVPSRPRIALPGEIHDTETRPLHQELYGQRHQQQDKRPLEVPCTQGTPIPYDMRPLNSAGQAVENHMSLDLLGPGPPRPEQVMPQNQNQGQVLIPSYQPTVMERKDADKPHLLQHRSAHHTFLSWDSYDGLDSNTGDIRADAQLFANQRQPKRDPPSLPSSSCGGVVATPTSSSGGMESGALSGHTASNDPPSLQLPAGSALELQGKAHGSDPNLLSKGGPLPMNSLAMGGRWQASRRSEGSWTALPALGEDGPATETEATAEGPPGVSSDMSCQGGPVPALGHPPGLVGVPMVPQTAEGQSPDQDTPLSAAEHRRLRRQAKASAGLTKPTGGFASSPGCISTEDRDASKYQAKFDMSALIQAQLPSDRPCLIVDLSSGRVLLSNALCNSMFATMCPLAQRDMADLIHEDDRLNFSACAMYSTIGRSNEMEPQAIRFLTAKGMQRAMLSGELVVGSCWCLDIALLGMTASTEAWELPEEDTTAV